MKIHQILIITVYFCLVTCNIKETHFNTWEFGSRKEGDRLLVYEAVFVPFEHYRSVETYKSFKTPHNEKINRFHIINTKIDGHPTEYVIEDGGIGYDFMSISFKSETGHGIYYRVELYGQ